MSEPTSPARRTRDAIVTHGGAFMTAKEMSVTESDLGLPPHSLYFRGRSAVLGDPPGHVVAAMFGIFPGRLVEVVIGKTTPALSAADAVVAYSGVCAAWGRRVFVDTPGTERAAELLERVVDSGEVSALPLAAGWRAQPRPQDAPARLAHALMLARELRGGLHFAALRACGLGVGEAVVADPGGGRARLLRTGWRPEDADALVAGAQARADLTGRWQRAEDLTDSAFDLALATLTPAETGELADLLDALPGLD